MGVRSKSGLSVAKVETGILSGFIHKCWVMGELAVLVLEICENLRTRYGKKEEAKRDRN